jgi:TRAP-type C4-dicarboxylate transport system permease small subunit
MEPFDKACQRLSDLLRAVGAACLVGMMALTCADVVGRYLGHPIFGSVEIVGYMAIMAVATALPYTHQVGAHIGVEIFMRLLPAKTQAAIDLTTNLLACLLFSVVTWRMAVYAQTMKASGEVSMNLEFPQ